MESKTRLGRNPFERPTGASANVIAAAASKKRVLTAANKKRPATSTRPAKARAHLAESPLLPDFLFHFAIEVPARGAFFAFKAWLVTAAFARELSQEARTVFSIKS